MVIDGRDAGRGMAINLICSAFSTLALDFAAIDRGGALEALARIELTIADALADFREKTGEGARPYDDAFAAMLDAVSTLVAESREAVKRGSTDPE